jgi:hypothetical protein
VSICDLGTCRKIGGHCIGTSSLELCSPPWRATVALRWARVAGADEGRDFCVGPASGGHGSCDAIVIAGGAHAGQFTHVLNRK